MKRSSVPEYFFAFCLAIAFCNLPALGANRPPATPPHSLECESLVRPIGVDTLRPTLSWKLQDHRIGAKQTAYEILVASQPSLLAKGRADIWDSGRILSSQSVGIAYGGPALKPEKRYYWHVQTWDKDSNPYPLSAASWWETGLLNAENWHGDWIGYEDTEHRSIREARAAWITNAATLGYKGNIDTRHDFRAAFDLSKPVRRAVLYATGEDTTAAWINGKQILETVPQPAWGRLPWRTYTRRDITKELHVGTNLLAIQVLLYARKDRSQTPMSSTLYMEMMDGSIKVLKTGDPEWRSKLDASGDWYTPQYDDASWKQPIPYPAEKDPFGGMDSIGSPLMTDPVAALRHDFQLTKPIASVRLYATALGAYRCFLNGKQVGDQTLSPGWTDYRERVAYQVYDVTPLLQTGHNAIGVYLAPGWYTTPLEWIGQGNNYGTTPPAFKGQLRIEHTDGSVEWIATNALWKADRSAIASAEIYDGESYDSRLLQPGWNTASFSDAKWSQVVVVHPQEPEIVWQSYQPIRAIQTLAAKTVTNPSPGTYIYDFGQNLAGFANIQVGGSAGTDVQLRFGEQLNPDGTLFVDNLRNAKATDHFILGGKGVESYQPSFTFHGFRYLEVTGLKTAPALSMVKAVVLHTDAPMTAQLRSGSPMLNKLWSNIVWGQRSNFVGVPTDCPQRDERLGWSADAQVFWRTASFNMDLAAFSRKYATDLRGTQLGTAMYGIYAPGTSKPNPAYATGWSDAGVIVPWTSWVQSGDTGIIEQNWNAMEKYLDAIREANPDSLWKNKYGVGFGDWLAPEGATSEDLIATAYWAYDVSLMKEMAHATGRDADEHRYSGLFEEIKAAFNQAYVRSNGYIGAPLSQNKEPIEAQTGYVLALHMNLLPDSLRTAAAQRLAGRIAANGGHLATGFLGTPYLLSVLTDTGHADVAYRLLLSTQYPSWGYMVEHGATTMWERWNGDQMRGDPGMNSYNHYAYGSVAEWIYRYAAGVDTISTDAGFHTILLHPNFNKDLGSLDFSYESSYGTIRSAWKTTPVGITWSITVPPNTTAHLPLSIVQAETYTVNGATLTHSPLVRIVQSNEGQKVYELAAGTYSFKVKMTKP